LESESRQALDRSVRKRAKRPAPGQLDKARSSPGPKIGTNRPG